VNRGVIIEPDAYLRDSDDRMPDLGLTAASLSASRLLAAVGAVRDKATYNIRVPHEEATS